MRQGTKGHNMYWWKRIIGKFIYRSLIPKERTNDQDRDQDNFSFGMGD